MTFEQWSAAREQRRAQERADEAARAEKESVKSSATETPEKKYTSFQEWNAARQQRIAGDLRDLQKWGDTSVELMQDVQKGTGKWYGYDAYASWERGFKNVMSQADGWKEKFAGNPEAMRYIENISAAVKDVREFAQNGREYYGFWENEDSYNTYNKWKNADRRGLDSIRSEIDDTDRRIEELKKQEQAQQWENHPMLLPHERVAMDLGLALAGKGGQSEQMKALLDARKQLQEEYDWSEYFLQNDESAWRGNAREDSALIQREIDEIDRQMKLLSASDLEAKTWGLDERVQRYSLTENGKISSGEKLNQLREKRKYLQAEKSWSDFFRYEAYRNNPDFAEKSKYVSQKTGEERNWVDIAMGNYDPDRSGWEDPLYEFINGNEEAGGYLGNQQAAAYKESAIGSLVARSGDAYTEVKQMTPDEIATFNYLYTTQGKEAAHGYYEVLRGKLNERQRRQAEDKAAQEAAKGFWPAVWSSIGTTAVSPFKMVSYAGQLRDYLSTGKVDENKGYNTPVHTSNAIRGQVSKQIAESGKWGEVGSFAYQTGMSMADFLFNAAFTGGNEAMSLAIMGTGAAADATIAAKERGLNDNQAFALGTIAGAAEIVTEKVSIETLLNPQLIRDGTVKYILKNMAAEGGEEVGSDIINLVADLLLSGDQAEMRERIRELEYSGKSEGEAFGIALGEQAASMGVDFLGGALSGGIMAGVGSTGYTVYTNATGKRVKDLNLSETEVKQIIDAGLRLEEEDDAYKIAGELKAKMDSGKRVSNYDLARLLEADDSGLETVMEQRETAVKTGSQEARDAEGGTLADSPQMENGLHLKTLEQDTRDAQMANQADAQRVPMYQEANQNEAAPSIAQKHRQEQQEMGGVNNGEVYREAGAAAAQPGAGAYAPEGTGLSDGSGERDAGPGPGEQDGGLAAGTENQKFWTDRRRETIARQNYARHLRLEKVSSRDLGLDVGTETKNIQVMPQEHWDGQMREVAQRIYNETGRKVTFVMGRIQVRGVDGNVEYARGVISGDNIIIQADNLRVSMEQIADHEIFHAKVDFTGGQLNSEIRQHIIDTFGEDKFQEVLEKYIAGMRGIVNVSEARTGEDFEAMVRKIEEEIFADAYAGINAFGANADQFTGAVNEKMNQLNMGKQTKEENGTKRTNGPPERFRNIQDAQNGTLSETIQRQSMEDAGIDKDIRHSIDEDEGDHSQGLSLPTLEEHNGYAGRSLTEDAEIYSYDFLTGQPDMQTVQLPELDRVRGADGRIATAKVVAEGMKNARAVGTERDGNVFVKNRYTEKVLRINPNAIRHGLNGKGNRLITNARLGSMIGEVVRNAIPINALKDTAQNVIGTYAMASYVQDSAGREFVAIVTVEEHENKVVGLNAYDVVHAISGRQKRSSQVDYVSSPQSIRSSMSASKISIAELLDAVNSTYQSILSDNVLERLGETRNPDGYYSDRVRYSTDEDEGDHSQGLSLPTLDEPQSRIPAEEIREIQGIGRKSVNQFTSEEIQKTERFARRYWQEMGTKSPFFRAWFGDWRAKDQTPIQVANQEGAQRGIQRNADTGWDIQVSGKVFNETKVHTDSYNLAARAYLPYINDIVKKAVLLDSYSLGVDKTKSPNSLLMHSLYAVADIGDGPEIVKLYVEEMNDPNRDGTAKRAYQLQNVEKYQPVEKSSQNAASSISSTAGIRSVADLHAAVKSRDANFDPKPVSDAVLNEDGTPKVFYHGTDAARNAYDFGRNGNQQWGDGIYLTPDKERAKAYGDRVVPLYVQAQTNNREAKQTGRAKDHIAFKNGDVLVFSPTQIKSAADNVGTFDGSNPDIRYSVDETDGEPLRGLSLPALDDSANAGEAEQKSSTGSGDTQAKFAAIENELAGQRRSWDEMWLKDQLGEDGYQEYLKYKEQKEATRKRELSAKAKEKQAAKNAAREMQKNRANEKVAAAADRRMDAAKNPSAARKEFRKTVLNLFSIPNGMRAELGKFADAYADRLIKNGVLTKKDRARFFERMYESGVMTLPANDYYAEARSYVSGSKIFVPDNVVAELGDEWNDIRRRAFAAGIYLTRNIEQAANAGGIEAWNAELAESFPGLFSAEETDMRSILERIVQVAEEGKDEKMSLPEYAAWMNGMDGTTEDAFLDAKERQLDWALRTFAEKAKLEVELKTKAEKEHAATKGENIRLRAENARVREERKETARRQQEQKEMGKNYAPIYTNSNYTKAEFGVLDASAEGVGNLKSRQVAANPSYNISAFEAFERHVDRTSRFCAMAIPTRNWNTLMNWREEKNSTSDVITHKWGEETKKYISDVVTALQGGDTDKTDLVSKFANKAMSNYISAVFGANPSIVLKQLGSIPMAGAYLGFQNFPSVSQLRSIDKTLISKYSQDLAWRTMGYSMPETKQLKDNPNWTQTNKVFRFLFGGDAITAMDGWAASTLWPWAENKVRSEHPELEIGTKEQIDQGESPFYKKVAEEFEDAVARSQSTSDEIHQSTLRKSKNPLARAFTLFRSDSAQTYNAIRQKIGEAQYYARTGEHDRVVKTARKAAGAAFCAMLLNAAWTEAVTFVMALWKHRDKRYRDGEDEMTAQSVTGEMVEGMIGSLFGTVTGGEELYEIIGNIITGETWYGIDTPGMEQLNDIIDAITESGANMRKLIAGGTDILKNGGDLREYLQSHSGEILGNMKDIASTAATYLPGLPVDNLEAYLIGAVKWVSPELGTAYEDLFSDRGKSDLEGLEGDALTRRLGALLRDRKVTEADETIAALAALYQKGCTGAIPSDVPASISVNEENRKLGEYQKQAYRNIWGSIVADGMDEMVSSEAFIEADDKTKEKMLKRLYAYAADLAKAELFDDYELQPGTSENAEIVAAGASIAECIIWNTATGKTGDNPAMKSGEKAAWLAEWDLPEEAKEAIFQHKISDSRIDTIEAFRDAGLTFDQFLRAYGMYGQVNSMDLKASAKALEFSHWVNTQDYTPEQAAVVKDELSYFNMTPASSGKYDALVAAGMDPDEAYELTGALGELVPDAGKDQVSDLQKWRASVDFSDDVENQMAALSAVMNDSQMQKVEIAYRYGILPDSYVTLCEIKPRFDADGNGAYRQAEITEAVDSLPGVYTIEQKAVLWQLATGSTSAKNNPYSRQVGQQVIDARKAAK